MPVVIAHLERRRTVTVTRADGRENVFTRNNAGVYVADPDVTRTLAPVTNGSELLGWNLTLADDTVEFYTPNSNLTSVTTRAGLVTTLGYYPDSCNFVR